jgi:CheY-like chemotaxis protein
MKPMSRQRRREVLKVLLADADVEVRRMMAGYLRHDGHQVLELDDGADLHDELSELADGDRHDLDDVLVVASVQMPVMATLTVLHLLGSRRCRLPFFILLTVSTDTDAPATAAELGALAILEKPFDPERLRAEVQRFATNSTEARAG